jgi:DNA-binding LacI/PurR family transcriptional regulator
LPVPIATVRQPVRALAEAAVALLHGRVRDRAAPPKTLLLAPEMVVRKT